MEWGILVILLILLFTAYVIVQETRAPLRAPPPGGRRSGPRRAVALGRRARRRDEKERLVAHLRFLTAGESHGKALLAIVEGVPAGLALSEDYIAAQLRRRQQGYGRGRRQQIEQDAAESVSGVRHGRTMGGPIGLRIENKI